MNLKDIGLRIKHQRLAKGITQKDLAEKIGTTWEMISRYETGKSSPMRKVSEIAAALDVPISKLLDDLSIEDGRPGYTRNTVPLLTLPFTDVHDAIRKTKNYYTAPDWIVHIGTQPFALETSILSIKSSKIEDSGIVFISSEKPTSPDDLIVVLEGNTIVLQPFSMKKSNAKTLGVVLSWEKRFR